MKISIKLFTILFLVGINLTNAIGQEELIFETPTWAEQDNAKHSEWLNFTSGFGDPGNDPDVEGSNAGGNIKQNTPGGTVTGTANIYNPAGASAFNLAFSSEDSVEQVVLQLRTLGTINNDSVVLKLEDQKDATPTVKEVGRIPGGFDDTIIMSYTWETSIDVPADINLAFNAVGPHLSLASVRLDVLTEEQAPELVFETPTWAEQDNAKHSEWLNFTSGFGDPGNDPDVEGSNAGGNIKQNTPGGTVTGTANIYNPAGASAFNLAFSSEDSVEQVVLQLRTLGTIDNNSVVLQLEGQEDTTPAVKEVGRIPGGFGDTIIMSYTWETSIDGPADINLAFNAVEPHLSLASVRLDVLGSQGSSEDVVINISSPSQDRWNYSFNITPGARAKASVFRSVDPEVGVSRHGTYVLVFDLPTDEVSNLDALEVKSVTLKLLTSNNFKVPYDPTIDAVNSYLPEDSDLRAEDEDPGRPVELFALGFNNEATIETWEETADYSEGEEDIVTTIPVGLNAEGEIVDVSLAADYENPSQIDPLALGTLAETNPGENIPEDTWMTFSIANLDVKINQYLSESLKKGKIGFVVTSLNGGGQGVRTFPEFHTRDSLLGEAPELELILTEKKSASVGAELVGISLIDDSFTLQIAPNGNSNIGIRWSTNLTSWNEITTPDLKEAGDNLVEWTNSDDSLSAKFYQIFEVN